MKSKTIQEHHKLETHIDIGLLGDKYQGQVWFSRNEKLYGQGRYIGPMGAIQEGHFDSGDVDGFVREIYEDGSYFIGMAKGDILDGSYYNSNGEM